MPFFKKSKPDKKLPEIPKLKLESNSPTPAPQSTRKQVRQSELPDTSRLTGKERFLLRRGNALMKKGDFEGALMYYQAGVIINPDLEEFQFAMFVANEKLGKNKPTSKPP